MSTKPRRANRASCTCDMVVYSDEYADRTKINDVDGHCSPHSSRNESLLAATMDSDRTASSSAAVAPTGSTTSPSFSGALKPSLPSQPRSGSEKVIMVGSSIHDIASEAALSNNNQSGLLSDSSGMPRPMSSASQCLGEVMQDHLIGEAASNNSHGRNTCNTRRNRKKTSSQNSSYRQRNNNGYNNLLPVVIKSLCWVSLAAANVFAVAATTPAATTTTIPPPSYSSAVDDDDVATTTTKATGVFNGITTSAPSNTTTTTTTTTTIGGLKVIAEEDVPLCPLFNKGQCQNNSQFCNWNTAAWACDYIHLPITASSPPTSMNSRPPPPSTTPAPTVSMAPTTPSPVIGGPKSITDTPTIPPSPMPTFRPTPKPSTKSPTPLPTLRPTTSAPSDVPTLRPTTKAPTEEPTYSPTTVEPTLMPTRKPTRKPTPSPTDSPTLKPTPKPSPFPSVAPTASPSVSPTAFPTASPSDFPSASPTAFPTISPKPTPLVWPSASPTLSSSPTASPSNAPSHSPSAPPSPVPTKAPTTLSPIPAGTTQSPISSPVSPPPTSSSTLQRVLIEKEPTSITLKNAYKMRRGSSAYTAWEEVTKVRIERYVQEMIGAKSDEKDVSVVAAIEDVIQRGEQSSDGGRRERRLGYRGSSMNDGRVLQEAENGPSSPLRLSFRTTLEFYSKQSNWDGSELIAAGFIEPSQQAEYISDLQKSDQGSFGSVNSMEMSVNGQVITKSVDENKNITQSNTLTYIIAGVVAGALVLFAVGGVYYVKRRNNRRDSGFTNHKGLSGRYPEKRSSSDFYSGNGKSGTMMSSPPNNSFPPPPPQSSSPVGDYFGTIEPRPGEDDVSTLGDPYIGDVHVNQAMGGDNTVTESLMSSGNDMYVYGVTRPRMYTGDSSRMGETTINTNSQRMTFQDDGTIEEFYGTPDATNFHSEKDSNFEHITVVARSGILGIVIDNPTGTTPYVHAIKESSILNGRVHVGDLLMSVDEVDCRGMTAVAVSKLIGSRSQNPTRTLRLLRGATLADVHGDSSAY